MPWGPCAAGQRLTAAPPAARRYSRLKLLVDYVNRSAEAINEPIDPQAKVRRVLEGMVQEQELAGCSLSTYLDRSVADKRQVKGSRPGRTKAAKVSEGDVPHPFMPSVNIGPVAPVSPSVGATASVVLPAGKKADGK